MDALLEWFNAEKGRRGFLATELKITPGAISQWDRVPIERAADIERITGIPRAELRPDIFGASHANVRAAE